MPLSWAALSARDWTSARTRPEYEQRVVERQLTPPLDHALQLGLDLLGDGRSQSLRAGH